MNPFLPSGLSEDPGAPETPAWFGYVIGPYSLAVGAALGWHGYKRNGDSLPWGATWVGLNMVWQVASVGLVASAAPKPTTPSALGLLGLWSLPLAHAARQGFATPLPPESRKPPGWLEDAERLADHARIGARMAVEDVKKRLGK